jgi:hypothetical protein
LQKTNDLPATFDLRETHIFTMLTRYVFLVLSVFFFENAASAQSKNTLHFGFRGSQPAIFGASLGYFRQVGLQVSLGTRLSSTSDFGRTDMAHFQRSQQADLLLRFAPNAHRRAFWSIESGPSVLRWQGASYQDYAFMCCFGDCIAEPIPYPFISGTELLLGSATYNSLNVRVRPHFTISLDLMTNFYYRPSSSYNPYENDPFVRVVSFERKAQVQSLVGYQVGGVWNW